MNILPATLVLLPDRLTDPIRILRLAEDGAADYAEASLAEIRQGEYGIVRPEVRRYEITDDPDPHHADLANRRVVVSSEYHSAGTADGLMPTWVLRAASLHPDRHDVAAWFRAARQTPDAPWVAHLAVVVRDALRDHNDHHPVLVAMPDRAYLEASADTRQSAVAPIATSFTEPVHEITETGRRTGSKLAPLSFASSVDDDTRYGVITRASAVLAEALVNSSDADGAAIADADALRQRWAAAVDPDHASRLAQSDDGQEFSAPLAILDDHGEASGRTTLLLATARISIAPQRRDIWIDYHEAISITANRPLQVDLVDRLKNGSTEVDADRAALIDAIREQCLPLLELCTTCDGSFVSHMYADALPDHVPLLPHPLEFTFPQAAAALMLFRQPPEPTSRDNATLRQRLWDFLLAGREARGGEDDTPVHDQDRTVPKADTPPPSGDDNDDDGHAPEAEAEGHVGDADQTAHETDAAGSEAGDPVQQEPLYSDDHEEDDDGDIPDEFDTGGESSGESSGSMDGAGELALRPDHGDEADISGDETDGHDPARVVAQAMVEDDAEERANETDNHGAEEDNSVAQSEATEAEGHASDDEAEGHVSDADQQAHGSGDQGSDDGRGGRYYALLAAMTDTDKAYVERVRKEVKTAMRRPTAPGALTEVEPDDHLRERSGVMADILDYVHDQHLRSNSKAARKDMPLVRQFAEADQPWYRMLYLLNLVQLVRKEGITASRKMTMRLARLAAELSVDQCRAAKLELPEPKAAQPAMPSAGGAHG